MWIDTRAILIWLNLIVVIVVVVDRLIHVVRIELLQIVVKLLLLREFRILWIITPKFEVEFWMTIFTFRSFRTK